MTINQNPYTEPRPIDNQEQHPISQPADPNATQRVSVEPVRRGAEQAQRRVARTAGQPHPRNSEGREKKSAMSKKERITIFILLGVAALLLIAVIIAASMIFTKPADDGLIHNNVFAAGVNLGGMTEEEAKRALENATADTYSKLDMTIQVLDTTITLPAKDTGAKLDLNAVVAAAKNSQGPGTISILPYLNLNENYIRTAVNELGSKYSSTLSQGTVTVEGDKPSEDLESYDTTVAYQTLVIYVGTAEYGLSTTDLYNQVMDAYNINLFQVVGQCSVVAPDPLNLQTYFDSICYEPVDATLDTKTYEVTKEVYGYGFDLTLANEELANAQYGDTIRIPIHFIEPDITAEMLAGDLFRDVIGSFTLAVSNDAALKANITLACKAINGLLLPSNTKFSFCETIGQPSVGKGYQKVEMFVDKELTEMLGGGISHVATALYNSALLADLDIIERHTHTYAPDFVAPGLDAQIIWGTSDLIFTNSTSYPIRIEAAMNGNSVEVKLIGTDDKDYYTKLETEVTEREPTTLIQTMIEDNAGGYVEGDILVEGITGYDVVVHRVRYEKQTNRLLNSVTNSADRYEKRNEIVVSIYIPEEPEVTTPSTPETDPSETKPSTAPTTPNT